MAICPSALAQGGAPVGQKPVPNVKTLLAPSKTKPTYANFNMTTHIGSFKMLEYNDQNQPEGHLEMDFQGTVLIDSDKAFKHNRDLTTQVTVTGNVRKEKDYHGRLMYHGKGKLILDGGWHAVEWFGTDLNLKLNGYGVFRLSGEFDKDLETGYFWYDDGKKQDWGTAGNQPTVPKTVYGIQKPSIKINGKGG